MAVLWLEGFEGPTRPEAYTSDILSAAEWNTFAGRELGSAEGLVDATLISAQVSTAQNTFIFGFGMFVESTASASSSCEFRMHLGSTIQFVLKLERGTSAPVMRLYAGASSGTPIASSVGVFMNLDTWAFVECKVTLDNVSSGSYEVRLDGDAGSPVLEATGVKTAALGGGADRLGFSTMEGFHFDDLRLYDESGTQQNDFEGPLAIIGFQPDSIGNSDDWANIGGAPNKVSAVTDQVRTTYLQSNTLNEEQLFAIDDLTGLVGTVYAVQLESRASVEVVGHRFLQHVARKGTTTYDVGDPDSIVDKVAAGPRHIMSLQPDGTPWTLSDLQNMQFGVKVGD